MPGAGIGAKTNAAIELATADYSTITWSDTMPEVCIPSGRYTFDETIELSEAKNLRLLAHGVTIVSATSADSVLKLVDAWNCIVEGLFIDARANTAMAQAVHIAGRCQWTRLENVKIQAGNNGASFAAFRVQQGDTTGLDDDNRDQGNYWLKFYGCWIRKLTGGDTNAPIGFDVQGGNNSMRIWDCSIIGVDIGVKIQNQNGSTLSGLSNDVQIHLTAFEGVGTAVDCSTTHGGNALPSVAITNCRFEVITTTCVNLAGFGSAPQPIWMSANRFISSVAGYVTAPDDTWWTGNDTALTPGFVEMRLYGENGLEIGTRSGSGEPPLIVNPKQVTDGGAIVLRRLNSTARDGMIAQRPGGGMDLSSPDLSALRLANVVGLSTTATHANNFLNTAQPAAGATHDVVFASAEADDNYHVFLSGTKDQRLWPTNKTDAGFTIRTSNAFTDDPSDTVSWFIIR